eukprot:8392012-Lingulodinium_polyedra.AAC.1
MENRLRSRDAGADRELRSVRESVSNPRGNRLRCGGAGAGAESRASRIHGESAENRLNIRDE